ncbi:Sperm-associated antigen 6 [Desmophyllum pertusum]|uniref:Sperm-associated antigen 6 n=1 Tax=Desmophyllum pertusum TaxID=174260 RepID=A0A9W9YQM0_9CNID|nr:Sperm-associated antigen 6 [Desmophyllum pertusum]
MKRIILQAAIAWALGQIGRHTPEHAKAVAVTNVLQSLLRCYLNTSSSEDLQAKSKKALTNILQKVCPPCRVRASTEGRTAKHLEACRQPVCQGTPARCGSTPAVCNKWRTKEGTGDQSRQELDA